MLVTVRWCLRGVQSFGHTCGAFALLFLLVKSFVCRALYPIEFKQKHKQLVVGFPVLSPRKFEWLCTLIFCWGRWDAQIVKRTRRAFSLLVKCFVLSRSRRRCRHGLLRSCCDHNRAIDLLPSGIFRISILSRCDETVILFPTRNWTNVKSFKLETEFQQDHKIIKQYTNCSSRSSVLTK